MEPINPPVVRLVSGVQKAAGGMERKSEDRNTDLRKKSEIREANERYRDECALLHISGRPAQMDFALRYSGFFRISRIGFRNSG